VGSVGDGKGGGRGWVGGGVGARGVGGEVCATRKGGGGEG